MRSFVLATFAAALLVAQGAGWKITLEPKAELKAGPPVPVQITITDAKGGPIDGAEVELVLTMVDMNHGAIRTPAHRLDPGVYEAKPKFMMEGKWNIEVRARKGSDSASMKQQVTIEE